jgi:hypothetical protein
MSQSNLIAGLKVKHAALLGELDLMERCLEKAKKEAERMPEFEAGIVRFKEVLSHIVPLLQHLDHSFEASQTKPHRPYHRTNPFKNGECARLGLDTLRRAQEPMTVREVALVILAQAAVHQPDENVLLRTCNALDATFRAYEGKTIDVMPRRRPKRWYVKRSMASQHAQD